MPSSLVPIDLAELSYFHHVSLSALPAILASVPKSPNSKNAVLIYQHGWVKLRVDQGGAFAMARMWLIVMESSTSELCSQHLLSDGSDLVVFDVLYQVWSATIPLKRLLMNACKIDGSNKSKYT